MMLLIGLLDFTGWFPFEHELGVFLHNIGILYEVDAIAQRFDDCEDEVVGFDGGTQLVANCLQGVVADVLEFGDEAFDDHFLLLHEEELVEDVVVDQQDRMPGSFCET